MKKNKFDFTPELARVIDDNISELMAYTHKSEKEILEILTNSLTVRNHEWESLSADSILNYHRSNQNSIYCLVKWNSEEKYQQIIQYINYICQNFKGRILDFGGGTGELTINLAKKGANIDFLEVPGNTLAYAKWRFKKRYFDITTYTSLNQVGNYDIIICLDVLETLEKPLPHLKKFYQLLNKNGLLILSTGEVGSPLHPMNLESNREFISNIDKYCQECGFEDSNIVNKFHLKIKQKN